MLVIVQSPYWFAIGCRGVFSLGGWTPHVQPGFPEPEFTRWAGRTSTTGLSPSAARHSNASFVVRLIRFRSPLLTELLLLSFPVDTEMFHFSTFALHSYAFRVKYPCGWVAPFRDPEIAAWLPAPSGLSQVPTSFIASRHQDIHRVPLSLGRQPDAAERPRRVPRIARSASAPAPVRTGRRMRTPASRSRDLRSFARAWLCVPLALHCVREPAWLGAFRIDRAPGLTPFTDFFVALQLVASSTIY